MAIPLKYAKYSRVLPNTHKYSSESADEMKQECAHETYKLACWYTKNGISCQGLYIPPELRVLPISTRPEDYESMEESNPERYAGCTATCPIDIDAEEDEEAKKFYEEHGYLVI